MADTDISLKTIEAKVKALKSGETDIKLTEEEEQFLVKFIETAWEQHPYVISRFPRWKKILAWVCGYQYLDYAEGSKRLLPVKLQRKRKVVFNRLPSFLRTKLGKMVGDVPSMGVIPATTDSADIEKAEAADEIVEALAFKLRWKKLLKQFKLWILLLNCAALRVFWDEEAEGITGWEAKPQLDINGNTIPGTDQDQKQTEAGDIAMEVIDPFSFRIDPLFRDRNKWRWFLYGSEEDAPDLEDEYDLDKGALRETSTVQKQAYQLDATSLDDDLQNTNPAEQEDVKGRTVTKKELWTKKIRVYEAGKKILECKANKQGQIPFFVFEDQLIPISSNEKGIVYNESDIRNVIPVQREYNRWISLISVALEKATKVKVMLPLNSILSKKQFTDDFATFIDFNPMRGIPPHQLKIDPLPAFVPTYKADLEREFETIMNTHEASFGRLPQRASHASGALVNLLVEQDDAVMNPLLDDMNDVFSDAWSYALQLVKDNYGLTRIIQYIGEDSSHAAVKFKGADLGNNTDVRVVSNSGLPRSRPLKIEYVMRLRSAGLLPPDPKASLELLNFGNVEKMFRDELIHIHKAERENTMIEESLNIDLEEVKAWVYPFDDHAAHFKVHLRDRLSAKFDKFSPFQKKAIELLIQLHAQALAQQAQQQMQAQAQPGRPGQGPQQPPAAAPPPGGEPANLPTNQG